LSRSERAGVVAVQKLPKLPQDAVNLEVHLMKRLLHVQHMLDAQHHRSPHVPFHPVWPTPVARFPVLIRAMPIWITSGSPTTRPEPYFSHPTTRPTKVAVTISMTMKRVIPRNSPTASMELKFNKRLLDRR
jgi:hypothetical protein